MISAILIVFTISSLALSVNYFSRNTKTKEREETANQYHFRMWNEARREFQHDLIKRRFFGDDFDRINNGEVPPVSPGP